MRKQVGKAQVEREQHSDASEVPFAGGRVELKAEGCKKKQMNRRTEKRRNRETDERL